MTQIVKYAGDLNMHFTKQPLQMDFGPTRVKTTQCWETSLLDLTHCLTALKPGHASPHRPLAPRGFLSLLIPTYLLRTWQNSTSSFQRLPWHHEVELNCFLWDLKEWFNWSLAAIFVSSVHSAVPDAWMVINRHLPHWMPSFPLKPPDRILHQGGIDGNKAFLCCTQCLLANIKVSS